MASKTGLITSFINTIPDKRMVTDRILMQDPYDIVAFSFLGQDMGKFNFAVNTKNKTYEWLETSYTDRTDTVASGLDSDSTTTTGVITTAALFQPGDVWQIEDEQVWVSAVSGTTITITREYNGTTGATHADDTAMTRVSRARIDGDDADDSPSNEITSNYNFTQIFQRTVNIARTKLGIAEWGVEDWENFWIDQYMEELMIDLAKLPYKGGRSAGTGNTVARSAGGFNTFITNNLTYATSTGSTGGTASALSRDHIDDTLANIHADGGDPGLIFTTAHAQRKINDMYEGFVQTERSEIVGGIKIKMLQNPITGKEIEVVVDRNCPAGEMWIVDRSEIAFYPFDPFFYERLGKTGDAVKGEVVGEYGLVIANDKHHGAVLEFSSSL